MINQKVNLKKQMKNHRMRSQKIRLTKKLQVQTVIVTVRILKRIQTLITPNRIQEAIIEVSNI